MNAIEKRLNIIQVERVLFSSLAMSKSVSPATKIVRICVDCPFSYDNNRKVQKIEQNLQEERMINR